MLGFMGTVIGMIGAFEAIAAENNISPAIVADGIGVALITTVSGLIVAIILQVFYNYILSKIDGIVLDMESFSIEMVDSIYVHTNQNKA
jgi:biopolymer transport protein ExbB